MKQLLLSIGTMLIATLGFAQPANNECVNAIPLAINNTTTVTATSPFNTTGATQSLAGCTGTADDDVWYSFTATSGTHNFQITTSANAVHQLFSGSCGTLTSLYCSDPDTSSYNCFVPGQVYYLRVYSFASATPITGTVGIGTNLTANATAATSTQICAPFSFAAGQNQRAGGAGCGANYGCLSQQPNPEYHWLQVTQSGTMAYNYVSSPAVDVDIAIWGPFSAPPNPNPAGCASLGGQPTITGTALGAPIYCDYSGATTGTSSSINVTAGQYYLLLITNFSNNPTTVSVSNAGGTATIACPTIISTVTSTPGTCSGSTNLYTLTGTVSYTNAPTTGTLTVSDNNGNSQVFNAPFASGSTSYSIAGNTANGASHTVTAVFSATPSAARCNTYNAPAACCSVPTPSAINVADQPCAYSFDLTASGGSTPYQWSTTSSFSSTITNLTGLRLPSAGAAVTYFVRSNGQTCYNSVTVQDPTPGTGLTPGSCHSCTLADAQLSTYYDGNNKIIAVVEDAPGGTALGATSVCAAIDPTCITSTVNGVKKTYMQRHYSVTPTTNGPATVTFYFTTAEVQALVTASAGDTRTPFTGIGNLAVFKYNGLGETPNSHISATTIPNSALTITGPTSNGFYTVSFAVTGFSGFYFGAGTATPLSLRLLSFAGQKQGRDNELRWETAEEEAGDYFVVERSNDAITWEARSADMRGSGKNSARYIYTDEGGAAANHFYRLRIMAGNGGITYSNTVRMSGTGQISVDIAPNPADRELQISMKTPVATDAIFSISNMLGQTLFSEAAQIPAGGLTRRVGLSDIPQGIYMLKVFDRTTNETTVQRFIRK